MAVTSVSLPVGLLSTACMLLAMSAPAFAQTPAATSGPTPAVPGNAVPPGTDTPGNEAQSQTEPGALVSILEKGRPDYDPNGVRVGALIVKPNVDVSENFTSNVFASMFNNQSDFYTTVSPTIGVRTDWDTNSLGGLISGDYTHFARFSTEDTGNFNATADGRLDILQGMTADATGSFQILHEPRGSANDVNGKTPTEYHLTTFSFGYVKENAIIGIKLNANINHFDYSDVATTGGTPIVETDRNRTEYAISGRVSYELAPQYRAFIRAEGNVRDYEQKFDAGGFQRSSNGYQLDAGTALSITGKIDGEFYIGYLKQNYDDPRLGNAGGLGFGADLLWNVTDLTSLRLSASRTVEETIVLQASSYIQTAVSLGVEHELLRNVLLSANLTYTDQAYQDFGRRDEIYGVTLSGKYLLTRDLATTLNIGYTKKVSNAIGISQLAEYEQALVALKLRLQF